MKPCGLDVKTDRTGDSVKEKEGRDMELLYSSTRSKKKKRLPKVYIVGKEIRYSDEALNKGDNRLPGFWEECCMTNIFLPLEAQTAYIHKGEQR